MGQNHRLPFKRKQQLVDLGMFLSSVCVSHTPSRVATSVFASSGRRDYSRREAGKDNVVLRGNTLVSKNNISIEQW